MAWYVLLLHASVVLATRWEWGLARRGLSAALLAAASAKMAVVPPRTVERSARYGLAATLGEVLRNTPHEVGRVLHGKGRRTGGMMTGGT